MGIWIAPNILDFKTLIIQILKIFKTLRVYF